MADILCIGGHFHGKTQEINDELLYSRSIVKFVEYELINTPWLEQIPIHYWEYEVLLIISPSGTKHYVCVYTGEEDEDYANSERDIS